MLTLFPGRFSSFLFLVCIGSLGGSFGSLYFTVNRGTIAPFFVLFCFSFSFYKRQNFLIKHPQSLIFEAGRPFQHHFTVHILYGPSVAVKHPRSYFKAFSCGPAIFSAYHALFMAIGRLGCARTCSSNLVPCSLNTRIHNISRLIYFLWLCISRFVQNGPPRAFFRRAFDSAEHPNLTEQRIQQDGWNGWMYNNSTKYWASRFGSMSLYC